MTDSTAGSQKFSWYKLFGSVLLDKDANSQQISVPVDEALLGKHVAVYFSAHWCALMASLLAATPL
jgi:hypothetical protein